MRRKEEDKSLEQRPKLSSQGYGAGAATDHLWREGLRVRHLVGNMENNVETVEATRFSLKGTSLYSILAIHRRCIIMVYKGFSL